MSSFKLVPPVETMISICKCFASSLQTCDVCRANSRVGTRIIPVHLKAQCYEGRMQKAAVFPVPFFALARMSLPVEATSTAPSNPANWTRSKRVLYGLFNLVDGGISSQLIVPSEPLLIRPPSPRPPPPIPGGGYLGLECIARFYSKVPGNQSSKSQRTSNKDRISEFRNNSFRFGNLGLKKFKASGEKNENGTAGRVWLLFLNLSSVAVVHISCEVQGHDGLSLSRGSRSTPPVNSLKDMLVIALLHEQLREMVPAVQDSIQCSIGCVCQRTPSMSTLEA
nr:hypothetical protein Iba_chr09cCG0580 [Ipomoea batatas]